MISLITTGPTKGPLFGAPSVSLNCLFYRDRDGFRYQWRGMRNMQVIAEQHLQGMLSRRQRNFGAAAAISEVYVVLISRYW